MRGTVRSVPMVIILSLITCGIYSFYWIYVTSSELKNYTNDPSINPTTELLLCIFTCGIYAIYWFYKYAKITYNAQVASGQPATDNSVICAIFGWWFSVIAVAILQSSLNDLWGGSYAN